MIRGSIEVAQRNRVSGWIYAAAEPVKDKVILAFVGTRCVGAGKIDKFRKDLLDAGLGDGHLGFDFAIKLQDDERLAAVVVKLQNSDVALIQRTSRLLGPDDLDLADDAPDFGAIPPERATWMQERGWLEQQEYDFLRAIHTIGAYERNLRPPRKAASAGGDVLKPELVAHDLLGLFAMSDVDVASERVECLSDLAKLIPVLRSKGVAVLGLWSQERCRLALEERSHAGPQDGRRNITTASAPGAIEYGFGPDRVLFLHRDASFAPAAAAPRGGISVFTATLKQRSSALPASGKRAAAA